MIGIDPHGAVYREGLGGISVLHLHGGSHRGETLSSSMDSTEVFLHRHQGEEWKGSHVVKLALMWQLEQLVLTYQPRQNCSLPNSHELSYRTRMLAHGNGATCGRFVTARDPRGVLVRCCEGVFRNLVVVIIAPILVYVRWLRLFQAVVNADQDNSEQTLRYKPDMHNQVNCG